MTLYVKCINDNVVWDAIEYPYEDYIPVEVESIPTGVFGGWWRLQDGQLVFDQALYDLALVPGVPQPLPDFVLLAQADTRILELEYENILLKEGLSV